MIQKNQILAITAIMPECLCASIIITAVGLNKSIKLTTITNKPVKLEENWI